MPGYPVNGRERFVEQQDFRVARQRPCDGNPLLLATGQFARQPGRETVKVYLCEQLLRALSPFLCGQMIERSFDIADSAHVREQRVTLKHEPY